MSKKSSVKLYYPVTTANGNERLTSKTINFVKNEATAEDITVIKTAFEAMMNDGITKVEKVTVEVL